MPWVCTPRSHSPSLKVPESESEGRDLTRGPTRGPREFSPPRPRPHLPTLTSQKPCRGPPSPPGGTPAKLPEKPGSKRHQSRPSLPSLRAPPNDYTACTSRTSDRLTMGRGGSPAHQDCSSLRVSTIAGAGAGESGSCPAVCRRIPGYWPVCTTYLDTDPRRVSRLVSGGKQAGGWDGETSPSSPAHPPVDPPSSSHPQ